MREILALANNQSVFSGVKIEMEAGPFRELRLLDRERFSSWMDLLIDWMDMMRASLRESCSDVQHHDLGQV